MHVGLAIDGVATVGAELVEMGSAGTKAMAVVRGEADLYVRSGDQCECDSCAPVAVAVAVALAHGLSCTRLDGSPLRYNREDVHLSDIICRPVLAGAVQDALADGSGTA